MGTGVASPPAQARLDPAWKTNPLSSAEMDDLVAFGEVLVEGRRLASGERRQLLKHIQDQSKRNPDYLALYRTAASLVNRLADRSFAHLSLDERIDVIARNRLAAPVDAAQEDRGPLLADMRALRTRTIPDLIRGYYAAPAGWKIAGYDTFPGRCGDLTRYTRPES
jgi:hypothetical protein